MASLQAELAGDVLRLSGPGAPVVEIPIQYDGKRRDVSLFGKWFGQGVVQDPAADKWFSDRLGKAAALVRVTPEHDRPGWGATPEPSDAWSYDFEFTSMGEFAAAVERAFEDACRR